MRSNVLVSLLVTVVLGDVVKVFTTDDDGTVHLGRDDGTGQNTTTDRNQSGEGALLVFTRSQHSIQIQFSTWPLRMSNGL